MNFDSKTPIGKAVDTSNDDRAEVEGFRRVHRSQENNLGRILQANEETAPDVEGHRLVRKYTSQPEADFEDTQTDVTSDPEVEGHLKKR